MVLRSLQGAAGHKMASQIAHAAPKALQKILRRSLFGVPNSGSISGSIFNGFVVDLWSFFSVLGIYANRFWMIRDIKIQSFWNRVRFSIPYPPERPNAKHQVSNFGICQDLPESARSLPGPKTGGRRWQASGRLQWIKKQMETSKEYFDVFGFFSSLRACNVSVAASGVFFEACRSILGLKRCLERSGEGKTRV